MRPAESFRPKHSTLFVPSTSLYTPKRRQKPNRDSKSKRNTRRQRKSSSQGYRRCGLFGHIILLSRCEDSPADYMSSLGAKVINIFAKTPNLSTYPVDTYQSYIQAITPVQYRLIYTNVVSGVETKRNLTHRVLHSQLQSWHEYRHTLGESMSLE